MPDIYSQSLIDKPAIYQIVVKGRLDASWTEWFDGLTVTVTKDEDGLVLTTLSGPLADQSALHGLLTRLGNIG